MSTLTLYTYANCDTCRRAVKWLDAHGIDPDDPAEQAYLAMLASRLKLDPGLRAAVETEAVKTVV